MSDEDIFNVFKQNHSSTGAQNVPLQVSGFTDDGNGIVGTRLDTGENATVRLSDLGSRDFTVASKKNDWQPGSLLAIDGMISKGDYYEARWVNRIASPDKAGNARFAMARCFYDSWDQFNDNKTKMETIGAPQLVTNKDEFVEAAVAAVKAASHKNLGWPKVIVSMRTPDGSQGMVRQWSAATQGESGHKQIAASDLQRAHYESDQFQKSIVQKALYLQENNGVEIAVHAASTINFGLKKSQALESYNDTLPQDRNERIRFINDGNTVNERTRYKLDESGQPQFAPTYFGFQHDQRTLVGVRPLSTRGPFFDSTALPAMERAYMKAIQSADLYAQGKGNPPSAEALRPAISVKGTAQQGQPASETPQHKPDSQQNSPQGAPATEPPAQQTPPEPQQPPESTPAQSAEQQGSAKQQQAEQQPEQAAPQQPSTPPAEQAEQAATQDNAAQSAAQPNEQTAATTPPPADVDGLASDVPIQDNGDELMASLNAAAEVFQDSGDKNDESEKKKAGMSQG